MRAPLERFHRDVSNAPLFNMWTLASKVVEISNITPIGVITLHCVRDRLKTGTFTCCPMFLRPPSFAGPKGQIGGVFIAGNSCNRRSEATMAADLAALKDWVTAADGEQFSRLPEGVVSVNISHSNITARMIELKFDLSQTVSGVPPGLVVPFL